MGRVAVARIVVQAITLSVSMGVLAQTAARTETPAKTKQMKMSAGVARLDKKVDAKNAKVGDPVTAHLMDAISCEDGTTLPKDATLTGHVVEAQPSQNKGDSKLVLLFDQVTVKGKAPIPVKVTLMGLVAPPVLGPDTVTGNRATDQEGVPAAQGGLRNGPAGASTPAPQTRAQQTLPNGGPPKPDYSTVPGVTLTGTIQDPNSGTLTSTGKNAKLEIWTQLQIAIIPLPPNAVLK
jgi:hypothetical protein